MFCGGSWAGEDSDGDWAEMVIMDGRVEIVVDGVLRGWVGSLRRCMCMYSTYYSMCHCWGEHGQGRCRRLVGVGAVALARTALLAQADVPVRGSIRGLSRQYIPSSVSHLSLKFRPPSLVLPSSPYHFPIMGLLRPATPGFLVTLVATILLAVVSFNVPIIKSIFFLKATITESGQTGIITLGTLGYCLELNGNQTCSKPTVGYKIGKLKIFAFASACYSLFHR